MWWCFDAADGCGAALGGMAAAVWRAGGVALWRRGGSGCRARVVDCETGRWMAGLVSQNSHPSPYLAPQPSLSLSHAEAVDTGWWMAGLVRVLPFGGGVGWQPSCATRTQIRQRINQRRQSIRHSLDPFDPPGVAPELCDFRLPEVNDLPLFQEWRIPL